MSNKKHKGNEAEAETDTVIEETENNESVESEEPVKAENNKPIKKGLNKVAFTDPLPKVKNTDKVMVKILRDFTRHKEGQEKQVTGFLAKQMVFKKVAKFIKIIE